MNAQTYRAQINAAIKPLGVKVVAGRGYSYFKSLATGDQVGSSVMVYRQSDLSIDRWVDSAKSAVAEDAKDWAHIRSSVTLPRSN